MGIQLRDKAILTFIIFLHWNQQKHPCQDMEKMLVESWVGVVFYFYFCVVSLGMRCRSDAVQVPCRCYL